MSVESVGNKKVFEIGEVIGAFGGFLRRPKSSTAGLTAYVFGENGSDADIISALHLTHYQDLPVKVSIWMIKNKHGRNQKRNNGYPLLTEFIARIRRPIPSMTGQMAQFFGENGTNSDAINVLNKSEFLDSFVFTQIQMAGTGVVPKTIETVPHQEDMDQESERLTPMEEKELLKNQKYAEDAERLLVMSGFYQNESVWAQLGNDFQFQSWLEKVPCCHPGDVPCKESQVEIMPIPGMKMGRFGYVPLCKTHRGLWESDQVEGVVSPVSFLKSRQKHLVQNWASEQLKAKLGCPRHLEITPSKVYSWAIENNLQNILPSAYRNFIGY